PGLLAGGPAWGGGRRNATSLLLEPLEEGAARELAVHLAGGLDDSRRARVVQAAEGNPLFLEQMLAMVEETGEAEQLPPTINALLAARLDLLEPREREALQRAAVVGREFWRGALGHDVAVAPLPPGDEERAALLPQLADARRAAGDFDGAAAAIDEALAAHDERVRLWAQLARARLRLRSGVDLDAAALEAETREAIGALER